VNRWPSSRARRRWLAAAAIALATAAPARADAVDDFYKRTPLTLVVGSDATGDYDSAARLLSRHLARHIPGRPSIVVQNMPGASGVKSANWLQSAAPRDGSVVATFNKGVPNYEATGVANVAFKSAEFNWIGSVGHSADLVIVAARTGVKTIEDAKRRVVAMGSIGAGGTMTTHPLILNNAVGARFKLVQGYASGQIVDLAMERGEVDGRGSYTWADLRDRHGELLASGKINILVQFALEREKDLPDVPVPSDFAANELERRTFQFLSADTAVGKAFAAPPGVPNERLAALRAAFDETMRDPEFLADAKRAGADIAPTGADALRGVVASIVDAPREARDLAQRWMREP
jgi:tripartite-type tricarboxylate transporter receptor subunit TctC